MQKAHPWTHGALTPFMYSDMRDTYIKLKSSSFIMSEVIYATVSKGTLNCHPLPLYFSLSLLLSLKFLASKSEMSDQNMASQYHREWRDLFEVMPYTFARRKQRKNPQSAEIFPHTKSRNLMETDCNDFSPFLFFMQLIARTFYRWHRLGSHQNIKGKQICVNWSICCYNSCQSDVLGLYLLLLFIRPQT